MAQTSHMELHRQRFDAVTAASGFWGANSVA